MKKQLLAVLLLLAATSAQAEVVINQAWARATAPGQKVGGVFMQITSSQTASLVGASCDCAPVVQVHESFMDNGIARMRQRENIELPAGKMVELKPGGLHIMLFDIKAPLKEGDHFMLKLKVSENGKATEIPVKVQVHTMGGEAKKMVHHHE